ncbi:GL17937 [Drosophila persimilis]|uniref:GL17937 n=2 Tax=Drosophila persimilis TaxID=7234 RepID=B4H1S1_DROPE|nr:GL17937 [Drosophila persimilis]
MHESPGVKAGLLGGVTAGSGNGLPPYTYKALPQEDKKPGNGAPLVGILKNGSATASQPDMPTTVLTKNGDIATRIDEVREEEEEDEEDSSQPPKEEAQKDALINEGPSTEHPTPAISEDTADAPGPNESVAEAPSVPPAAATPNGQLEGAVDAPLPVSRGHEPPQNLIKMAPLVTISETNLHEACGSGLGIGM